MSLSNQRRLLPIVIAACIVAAVSFLPTVPQAMAANTASSAGSTADHSKFDELDRKFNSGPEVTKACLGCHTEAAKQIHKTTHWTWEYKNPRTGQLLGKKHVVNNFCISTASNIQACGSCHIGYGWKDDTFDFSAEENVDCLVCHDTTRTYTKDPKKKAPKLKKVAQNVGATSRATCGECHFKGGGGAAVKHGDLDPSLKNPDVFVDVHMDADGLDFTCSTCHSADQHAVAGSRYSPKPSDTTGIDIPGRTDGTRASCQSCHGDVPHPENAKLNDHTDKLACQTCHIPEYSRGDYASKEWWDWSTAGQLNPDNTPLSKADARDHEIYNSKKGDFRWEEYVIPEYTWFNGTVDYTLLGDRIDPAEVVPINSFRGNSDDLDARIWPVKVMRGKQPYDVANATLAVPHTVGEDGFWKNFDWGSALAKGMAAAGAPFSGDFGFVETRMTWPITHMVAPKEQALGCPSCHTKGGRLAGISGVYIPGRDSSPLLDTIGFVLLALTLAGTAFHGVMRFIVKKRG
jgi:octaheme c-type cytochrome (tetrathionate reductase family)